MLIWYTQSENKYQRGSAEAVGAGGNKQRAPKREGQSPKGAVLRDETRRMQKTATNGNVYLGRDPEGPLAPEEGQRPYSIHPPPNGDVRITNPETYYET